MQEKAATLESTQGVEGDKRYMRKVYNTLSEDNRKKLEVYAAALRPNERGIHHGRNHMESGLHTEP